MFNLLEIYIFLLNCLFKLGILKVYCEYTRFLPWLEYKAGCHLKMIQKFSMNALIIRGRMSVIYSSVLPCYAAEFVKRRLIWRRV